MPIEVVDKDRRVATSEELSNGFECIQVSQRRTGMDEICERRVREVRFGQHLVLEPPMQERAQIRLLTKRSAR
jgi:hypothetical protein